MSEFIGESIKVMGVGNVGLRVLQSIDREDVCASVLHTDVRALEQVALALPKNVKKVLLGRSLLHGLGTGGDVTLGNAVGEAEREAIEAVIGDAKLLFLVVGLGGGTGSSLGPLIAKLAVLRGVYVFAYALLPFEFEGKKRFEVANHALKELESVCDVVICLQNDFLLNGRGHNVPQDTLVVEAFECAHKWIWNGIRGIIQVARGEGLLLGDQRALLNFLDAAKNEQCVFGVGSGAGKDCERVALEQLRQCPFFVLRNDWKIAHAVIVLRSGKDFTQVRAMECAKKITDLFGIGEQRIFCLEIDEHAQQVLDVYIIGIAKEQFRMGGRYCLYSEDTVGWELLVSGKQDVASWQEGLLREVDMDVPTYMRLNIPLSR